MRYADYICSVYPMEMFFSETVSLKNNGQVCLDRKIYQDAILVSFATTPPEIITATQTNGKISSPY